MVDELAGQLHTVDIEYIAHKCDTLMASDVHNIKLFTDSFVKKLFKCSHSSLLKIYLLPFITWFDNTILRELIAVYENIDTLELFCKFICVIDDSKPITSYPIPTFSQLMIPLDNSEYTIVATETCRICSELTLKDVKDIKDFLRGHWELTVHAIHLVAIDYNCIYWMIPRKVVPLIKKIDQDSERLTYNEIYLCSVLPDNFFFNFNQQINCGCFTVSNFSSQHSAKVCES